MAKNFTEIIAWQEAKNLCKVTYQSTNKFPKEEIYGLINQMRRAATSVAANIAEGWGCNSSKKQFIQFINNASGSLAELESHVEVAYELQFLDISAKQNFMDHIRKTSYLLNRLRESLR